MIRLYDTQATIKSGTYNRALAIDVGNALFSFLKENNLFLDPEEIIRRPTGENLILYFEDLTPFGRDVMTIGITPYIRRIDRNVNANPHDFRVLEKAMLKVKGYKSL